jgi:DNA-binding transcriptional regulator LsrR (DeoR family)
MKSTKQRGAPWTADERAFVINAYPALGPAAIAKKLGRSRSGICKLIAELKETGAIESTEASRIAAPAAPPASPPHDAEDGRQDTLGRLRWVRSLLERQLYDAAPTTAARLAKEYRDTIDAIDKLEREGGEDGNDIIGQLADSIARRIG